MAEQLLRCPGFELPDGTEDQHGNPVITRNGLRIDSQTGLPYDAWLKAPRIEFVLMPAGRFMMGSKSGFLGMGGERDSGSDERRHKVRLTSPFLMAKYELTQAQYEAVMGGNPSHFKGTSHPVETVSWNDAVEFCERLSVQSGGEYRLPSEAQWEYACRAGSQTAYCLGDGEGALGYHAWYGSNSDDETHPVGQKKPNAWGLYDMHGNVWEWCQDRYGGYPSGSVTDPEGPGSGSYRVLRGGSFRCAAGLCRSALRRFNSPGRRFNILGFRPSRSLP